MLVDFLETLLEMLMNGNETSLRVECLLLECRRPFDGGFPRCLEVEMTAPSAVWIGNDYSIVPERKMGNGGLICRWY